MLFRSSHITVTLNHGIGTLAFGFGGEPANALDVARLREFDLALDAIAACPTIKVLIIRSSNPCGFCSGLSPLVRITLSHPADRSAFAWYGQQVMERLASLEAVSIAYIAGPCLGAGFELALACDHRLCVTTPTTPLGFPERRTCFGGSSRLRAIAGRRGTELLASGRIISGREARRLKLVDFACSERRAKIELRACLDRIETQAAKPVRWTPLTGLAAERRAFSAVPLVHSDAATTSPTDGATASGTVGLLGNDAEVEKLLAAATLRGDSLIIHGDRSGIFARISDSKNRGFITPLEAERTRLRVRIPDTWGSFSMARLVFVAEDHNPFKLAAAVSPRTVVCAIRPAGNGLSGSETAPAMPFPFPRRFLYIGFCGANRVALFPDANVDSAILEFLKEWFKPFGYTCMVFPAAARLLPRAA